MHVIDFFDRGASFFPERACLVDAQSTLTYAQVRAKSLHIAAMLQARGGAVGARIGVLAPNCVEAFVVILGILRAGAVWVPVNSRATTEEIRAFLDLVDCNLLFAHADLIDAAEAICADTDRELVQLGGGGTGGPLRLEQLLQQTPAAFIAPECPVDAVCTVFSTGGTTGKSKASMWTHRTWTTLVANFLAGIHHDGPPVHLVAAPMTHAAGVISLPLMAIGATTVLIARAEPELVMSSIEHYRVTTMFLPPTAIYMMLAHPDVRRYDYSSLQNLIYAAAPMSVEKLRQAMSIFGPVMVQTYGQAEAPMVCTIMSSRDHVEALQGAGSNRLASCGRPALLTDLAIMSADGEVLAPGNTGEIVVRGELVMAGYMNDPAATSQTRLDGWHRTGDIGWQDQGGFVYITDRKRDMIISGGFNVFPSEIEQVLWSHQAVQDCAVIGVPDDKWGEKVVAVVELKSGTSCTADELIQLCKSRLGSIKAPKSVEFWRELPRSPVGKVLKRKIRDTFWEGRSRQI